MHGSTPMHDIGKIAVPDVILQKPGKLTGEEFEAIKQHTVCGGKIIQETFGHLGNEQYAQKRCYREAMPLDKCFDIIQEGSGQDFDPLLVEVFLDIRLNVEEVHHKINYALNEGGN